MRIVPTFDEFKDRQLCLDLCPEAASVEELAFQGCKEAFGHCVVVAVADGAARGTDSHFRAALAERAEYRSLLQAYQLIPSMSRLGNCWDNAVAESFFSTLKQELVTGSNWKTRREATTALVEFIEVWYNRQRRHQTLGYRTPVQYETEVLNRANAA